jgi:phosphate transport system protein
MVEHTTRAFDSDLQELAKKILYMGRSDDEQIANAIEALLKRDAALARSVIAADDLIDAQQRDIEENAIATIARRQPMAVDLREIVGALRISNDLERVGDLAENIAKRMLLLERFPGRLNRGYFHAGANMIQASCWEEASMEWRSHTRKTCAPV